MRHQNRGFARSERVNDQIQRDLSEIIRSELKDPRVGMVTITAVEVTPDYAHATVYFTQLAGKVSVEDSAFGLQKAAGFLRSELGKRIKIHQSPQLKFKFEASLERGVALSALIDQANSVRARD